MLPGPVFTVELLTTARRPRYFFFRAVFASVLLLVIWQNYVSWDRFGRGLTDSNDVVRFANTTFNSIVFVQVLLVLVMTPSLVAGVIANEKQRKTLHYLLTSSLTSGEIVLGKLMARLLHLTVMVAIGLPIMSLLSLVGGVDPVLILLSFFGTLSIAFFVSCLSVYRSTISKKVRDAIGSSYAVTAGWAILPLVVQGFMPMAYPQVYFYLKPWNDWWLSSTPWGPLVAMTGMFGSLGSWALVEATAWMIGLQTVLGCLLLLASIARLRPVFKTQDGAPSKRFLGVIPLGKTRRIQFFQKRPVGDDAMMWKELNTSRTTGAAQVVGILVSVLTAGVILYWAGVYGLEAFNDVSRGANNTYGSARQTFNGYLRMVTTGIAIVGILAAAVSGANTISSEREEDTWLSLLATPMSGQEILRAKFLGTLWPLRWAFGLLVILWVMGLLAESIHPLAALAQCVELLIFVTFASALGILISQKAKTSWRAQSLTMGFLLTVMGGYVTCICPFMFSGRPSYILFSGVTPFVLSVSLFSPYEFQRWANEVQVIARAAHETQSMIFACEMGTFFYAFAAVVMGMVTLAGFDSAADRPRRDPLVPLPDRAKKTFPDPF